MVKRKLKLSAEQPTLFAIGYKIFFGFVGFAALAAEVATLVERRLFDPISFFSYFTIITNIFVILTLIVSAVALAHGVNNKLSAIRSAATVYAVMVGASFSALLLGADFIPQLANTWSNVVLHYIIPLAVLLDYIFDRPQKTNFNQALYWLIFPLVYVIYTIMHGLVSGWYPLILFNPITNGVMVPLITMLAFVVMAFVLIWLVARSGKERSKS